MKSCCWFYKWKIILNYINCSIRNQFSLIYLKRIIELFFFYSKFLSTCCFIDRVKQNRSQRRNFDFDYSNQHIPRIGRFSKTFFDDILKFLSGFIGPDTMVMVPHFDVYAEAFEHWEITFSLKYDLKVMRMTHHHTQSGFSAFCKRSNNIVKWSTVNIKWLSTLS